MCWGYLLPVSNSCRLGKRLPLRETGLTWRNNTFVEGTETIIYSFRGRSNLRGTSHPPLFLNISKWPNRYIWLTRVPPASWDYSHSPRVQAQCFLLTSEVLMTGLDRLTGLDRFWVLFLFFNLGQNSWEFLGQFVSCRPFTLTSSVNGVARAR